MKKGRGRPPASNGAVTRERILQAAEGCFAELGYEKGTLQEIAERADLTLTAVYHYFRSKGELFEAVCERARFEAFKAMSTANEREGFVGKVEGYLDALPELHRRNPYIPKFSAGSLVDGTRDPEIGRHIDHVWRDTATWCRQIADEALASGELKPGIDPAVAGQFVQSILLGITQHMALTGGENIVEILACYKRLFEGQLTSGSS